MSTELRIRALWKPTSHDWGELNFSVQVVPQGRWQPLTAHGVPLLVARRYSGKDNNREAPELYLVSALRSLLEEGGATVVELQHKGQKNAEVGGSITWSYSALVTARLTVALRTMYDGSVRLVALS